MPAACSPLYPVLIDFIALVPLGNHSGSSAPPHPHYVSLNAPASTMFRFVCCLIEPLRVHSQCTHTMHLHNALIQCTYTVHLHKALKQCSHTMHSRSALTQCTHAVHSHNVLTQCTHTRLDPNLCAIYSVSYDITITSLSISVVMPPPSTGRNDSWTRLATSVMCVCVCVCCHCN